MKTLLLFLLLIPLSLFAQCGGDITFDLNIPPAADGTYPPNTTVELCVTMTNWNGNAQGSNWLEGFGLSLGNGWINITPITSPNDTENDASGTWIWVETVTSDATGLTAGPGYFFEGPTGPTDGNPGNDWGDYCMNGDCIWTFCIGLTTSGVSGESLDIGVTPYADGSMGSWGTEMCFDVVTEIIDSEVGCNTYGCTDPLACNYDINAACDDGSCDYFSIGNITTSFFSDTVCVGLETFYSVSGDGNSIYNWNVVGGDIVSSNGSNNCSILWGNVPGVYTITVQEITTEGCISPIETYDIKVIVPDITFDTTKLSICLNSSININAYPLGGTWSSEFMNGNTFTGITPGTYYPSYLTNIYGCDVQEEIEVEVKKKYDAPNIIYSAEIIDLCIDFMSQTYIADDTIGVTYAWFIDNAKQPFVNNILNVEWYDTTQTYIIKVIAYDALGCESEPKSISVKTESCQRFFTPNSFTPNNDGMNDIFEIKGLSVYKPTMKIFNRWGELVYVSSNLWWTGDSGSGYYSDSGVYNWIIEYKDKNGFNKIQKGFVTLIR